MEQLLAVVLGSVVEGVALDVVVDVAVTQAEAVEAPPPAPPALGLDEGLLLLVPPPLGPAVLDCGPLREGDVEVLGVVLGDPAALAVTLMGAEADAQDVAVVLGSVVEGVALDVVVGVAVTQAEAVEGPPALGLDAAVLLLVPPPLGPAVVDGGPLREGDVEVLGVVLGDPAMEAVAVPVEPSVSAGELVAATVTVAVAVDGLLSPPPALGLGAALAVTLVGAEADAQDVSVAIKVGVGSVPDGVALDVVVGVAVTQAVGVEALLPSPPLRDAAPLRVGEETELALRVATLATVPPMLGLGEAVALCVPSPQGLSCTATRAGYFCWQVRKRKQSVPSLAPVVEVGMRESEARLLEEALRVGAPEAVPDSVTLLLVAVHDPDSEAEKDAKALRVAVELGWLVAVESRKKNSQPSVTILYVLLTVGELVALGEKERGDALPVGHGVSVAVEEVEAVREVLGEEEGRVARAEAVMDPAAEAVVGTLRVAVLVGRLCTSHAHSSSRSSIRKQQAQMKRLPPPSNQAFSLCAKGWKEFGGGQKKKKKKKEPPPLAWPAKGRGP